mmetsp:Transcript_7403/g.27653  ORF Transcript_7403/g.27653 Transcript_7403/m.27653 type:complete len:205 (-) Transcript_7403:688-1302(-)
MSSVAVSSQRIRVSDLTGLLVFASSMMGAFFLALCTRLYTLTAISIFPIFIGRVARERFLNSLRRTTSFKSLKCSTVSMVMRPVYSSLSQATMCSQNTLALRGLSLQRRMKSSMMISDSMRVEARSIHCFLISTLLCDGSSSVVNKNILLNPTLLGTVEKRFWQVHSAFEKSALSPAPSSQDPSGNASSYLANVSMSLILLASG